MELTNFEKAKVFAIYLGCKFKDLGCDEDAENSSIYAIDIDGCVMDDDGNVDIKPKEVKLILRTIEQLTDEDALVIAGIHYGRSHVEYWAERKQQYINYVRENVLALLGAQHIGVEIYLYMVSKGYAVPLYFGEGHEDNWSNAIALGLAIPAAL